MSAIVTKSTQRLVRLLSLVAYLEYHQRVPVEQLAKRFGTTKGSIIADVNLLWQSGLPGGMHGDLIDFDAFDFDNGLITLSDSLGVHRSFGLSDREAIALTAALQAMRATATQLGVDADVQTLIDGTLEALAAAEPDAGTAVDIAWAATAALGVYPAVTDAIRDRTRLAIDYAAANDDRQERVIEPVRIRQNQGFGYLDAWCTKAEDWRSFRLDRIHSARPTVDPAQVPVDLAALPSGSFQGVGDDGVTVRVTFGPAARAVAETVPHTALTELDGGAFTLELNVVSPDWFRGLLLSYADQVREVSPADFGVAARVAAVAALARYEA